MVIKIMPFQISSYGLSDVGHVRDNNEDVWAAFPESHFYVLADGMGGHVAGEVAAEETVLKLSEFVKEIQPPLTLDEAHGLLQLAIEQTNTHVYELGLSTPSLRGMGTTLCCLLFLPNGLVFGHVGDSRIYRIREKKLEQLTVDHSLVREMIDQGHLSPNEGEEAGFRNIITRAMGTDRTIEPSVQIEEVSQGDIYFMCTDGLTDMLAFEELEAIISQYDTVELITEALVAAAKERGGRDNVTVVTCKIESI